MNDSQVAHFNYVGDSILGTKSHLSAGAITSNFRLDGKNISVAFKN
jgi:bifunctional N-acetylglucosamine-1-phosphate-uridyltransferase/glucosamine-1-phosphate-acetyltransferase GlmU-like protein